MALAAAAIPGLIIAEDAIIYNTVAASMFIFWDHCLTFSMEVDLIWRSRQWNIVNTFFFLIRYTTLIIRIVELVFYTNVFGLIQPSPSQCEAWLRFEAASGLILSLSVEIILVMRVFAFYGRSRFLLAILIVLLICETAAVLTILGLSMPKILIVPNPLPPNLHAGACLVVSDPPLFANYWVPKLIFETILFLLVLVQFVHTRLHAEMDTPHVLNVFVRDGAWAFVLIFTLLLWNTLSFELTPVKGDVALTWLYSILGFCGTRLVLNLRCAAEDRLGLNSDEGIELDFCKNSSMRTSSSGTGYTTATELEHVIRIDPRATHSSFSDSSFNKV